MKKKRIKNVIKRNDVVPQNSHPYNIGKNYLVRTVTMIYTGKLVEVYKDELVFISACWIPDTERWSDSVSKGIFKEQEPYPQDRRVIIGRGAILDCVEVDFLITEQK